MRDKTKSIGIMSAEIQGADGEFQLLPAGVFRAKDGRPKDAPAYVLEERHAALLIARFNKEKNPISVDYEHQSILTKENGKPAPAAGWVHGLDWRPGKGLFAVQVEWTEAAKEAIKANEYRYISPVFDYRKNTGEIIGLFNAGLTNNPAFDGMEAAVAHSLNFESEETSEENKDEGEEAKREALRLEIAKAQTELETLNTASAALKAEQEALKRQHQQEEIERVIDGYVAACKLCPAERDAALTLARYDIPAIRQLLHYRASFFGMQSETMGIPGKLNKPTPANLNDEDLRTCELTGRKPESAVFKRQPHF